MARWNTICCGIDFSEASRAAMVEAADLALRSHAELVLVHVYELTPPPVADDSTSTEDVYEAIAVDLERCMAASRSEAARRAGEPVRSRVRVGDPAAELLAFAKEAGADVVVLGAHGGGGSSGHLLGSVAERVVREAPCPVLVVRDKELGEATVVDSVAA